MSFCITLPIGEGLNFSAILTSTLCNILGKINGHVDVLRLRTQEFKYSSTTY